MNDYQEQKPAALIPMNVQQFFTIAIIGALVGAITWGLTLILDMYVVRSMVCEGNNSMQCATSLEYSSAIATVAAAALGLLGLAKFQIFRSLLVVVAASASLWGLMVTLSAFSWQIALPVSLLLFMVAYGVFAWLARIRSFVLAVVVMVVLVVAVRLAVNF